MEVERTSHTVIVERIYVLRDAPPVRRPQARWMLCPDGLTAVWRDGEWQRVTVHGAIQDSDGADLGRRRTTYYHWSKVPPWLQRFLAGEDPAT